ncbi:hypothetical protein [Paenibacillus hamazuiensis]|uniref:hypothetical protein n=1 Tax=Paenibacillus hamazuiensis TaxID=2936508 RepID=UPI00200D5A43|nr:hypothetical protein [Paenibacillus hamazuiensis]
MSQSKAKKMRLKQIREGRPNPETKRGGWNGIVPVERTSPTLQEQQTRQYNKHKRKWNHSYLADDGSIFRFRARIRIGFEQNPIL